jgi:hypothetical protein
MGQHVAAAAVVAAVAAAAVATVAAAAAATIKFSQHLVLMVLHEQKLLQVLLKEPE